MAELRVDRIHIDGPDVRIGVGSSVCTRGPTAPPRAGLAWLQRVPLRPSAVIGAGAVILAVGVGWGSPISRRAQFGDVSHAGILSDPAGCRASDCGDAEGSCRATCHRARPHPRRPSDRDLYREARSVVARPGAAHTVESLARILEWSQADVVKSLGWLQARGELAEDIDLSTGQFVYAAILQAGTSRRVCAKPQTGSNAMKSKSTAGILALLLGGIGAHKFYLDRPLQGLLYLFFFWTFIPAIIALVEAIGYFTMSDAAFNAQYNASVAIPGAQPQNIVVNVQNTAASSGPTADRVSKLRDTRLSRMRATLRQAKFESEKRLLIGAGKQSHVPAQ